ncbi:MAG: tRNA 2-thiouridine(34) synthase MnmA, partial [Candidatus Omnitrophota bacterium]
LCNQLIKFGYFFNKVDSLGIDYLATGHYARITKRDDGFFLQKGRDERKSQEYFLSLINPSSLSRILFPLGNLTKSQVKRMAKDEGIIFKERGESQDICFVNGRNYAQFIEENTPDFSRYAGDIQHINGKILGRHSGIYHFTYGQREGLRISWRRPLYVAGIDTHTNTVIVAEKECLYKDRFCVSSLNWFRLPSQFKNIQVKVRYNSPFYNCDVVLRGKTAEVVLKGSGSSIAFGQVATFYSGETVLGGGIISKVRDRHEQ